jgi:outer membrane protein TolC
MHLHAQSLLPLAERSLRAAQAGYQSGRVQLSLLLETARRLFEHQLDFERYQAELGGRLAELEAESGLPLLTAEVVESGPAAEGAKR